MTITTASDTIPQPLLDLLAANSLHLVDPDELATLPAGPFTATCVRQDGDVVALTLSLPSEDEVSSVLVSALMGAFPRATSDLPFALGSLDELASQLPIPLDVNAVTSDGRVVAWLAVPVDRRSGSVPTASEAFGGATPASSMQGVMSPPTEFVGAAGGDATLGLLRNVTLEVTVELGRASMTFAQLLGLTVGSVVELDRAAGSPVDIRVNGMLFGRGEVVVVDEEYAVRIVEILNTEFSG